MQFHTILLDGSVSSMGNLLWGLQQPKRVWVVLLNNSPRLKQLLDTMEDCNGSLCHFENKKCVMHISYVIQGITFISHTNPEEIFFKLLSEMEEEHQDEILNNTYICDTRCENCEHCKSCKNIAESYGIYDVIQRSF